MKTRLKAVAYARTSTVLQQDPHLQITALREYARQRDIEIVGEYIDQVSGVRERRLALDSLMAGARSGAFDIVLVKAIDRIGRSTRHLLTLIEELDKHRVAVCSVREQFDLSTPSGRMVFTVLSAVAQLERELIRERIRVALASKKLIAQQTGNGWRCGRPPKVTPALIASVRQLRNEGLSIRQIASRLAIAKASVQRALASVPKP